MVPGFYGAGGVAFLSISWVLSLICNHKLVRAFICRGVAVEASLVVPVIFVGCIRYSVRFGFKLLAVAASADASIDERVVDSSRYSANLRYY